MGSKPENQVISSLVTIMTMILESAPANYVMSDVWWLEWIGRDLFRLGCSIFLFASSVCFILPS